jgi:hypothetical protein
MFMPALEDRLNLLFQTAFQLRLEKNSLIRPSVCRFG